MDFIPFHESRTDKQKHPKTPQNLKSESNGQKLAFGSPAIVPAFGSPAVGYGGSAAHSSGFTQINKTPSPRHYSQNFTPGFKQKSPRGGFNNTARHPYNNFRDQNSSSPRNLYLNNPKNSSHQKKTFSPRPLIQDYYNSDGSNFKTPQSPSSPNNRGRGMGRKSMTWTYGQVKWNAILALPIQIISPFLTQHPLT